MAFCALRVKRFSCIFFSFFFFLAGIVEGYAQSSRLLVAWDLPQFSTTRSVGSGFNDPAVLADNIALGSGLTSISSFSGWGATSWGLGGVDR